MYIYQAIQVDNKTIPPREVMVKELPTEDDIIEWLENNGGGIYRNILHGFDCVIKPLPSTKTKETI